MQTWLRRQGGILLTNFLLFQAETLSECPNQDSLAAAIQTDHTEKKRDKIAAYRTAAGAKFLDLFPEYDVDATAALTDSLFFLFSIIGGKHVNVHKSQADLITCSIPNRHPTNFNYGFQWQTIWSRGCSSSSQRSNVS